MFIFLNEKFHVLGRVSKVILCLVIVDDSVSARQIGAVQFTM